MPQEPWLEKLTSNWFTSLADRLRDGGRYTDPTATDRQAELAKFHERLEELRTLAETSPDQVRSGNYSWLWRTMGEELAFVADDLDHGRITSDQIPAAYEQWKELGRSYVRSIADNGAADGLLPAGDSAEDAAPAAYADTRDRGEPDNRSAAKAVATEQTSAEATSPVAPAGPEPVRQDPDFGAVWLWPGRYADTYQMVSYDPNLKCAFWNVAVAGADPVDRGDHVEYFDAMYELEIPEQVEHLSYEATQQNAQALVDHLYADGAAQQAEHAELRRLYHLADDTGPAPTTRREDARRLELREGGSDPAVQAAQMDRLAAFELDLQRADEPADEDMRRMTAELAVDPVDDVVWGGVVMSRAELDLYEYGTEFGDGAAEADDTTTQAETTGADPATRGDAMTAQPELHGPTDTGGVSAAVETSACSVAVSRASAAVETAARTVEDPDSDDRADQLATWHNDDQVAQREAQDQASKPSTTAGDTVPF